MRPPRQELTVSQDGPPPHRRMPPPRRTPRTEQPAPRRLGTHARLPPLLDQEPHLLHNLQRAPRRNRCLMPSCMICATSTRPPLLPGVSVHVVAARLGHEDPAVTLRVYSHVLREHAGQCRRHLRPGCQGLALANPLARRGSRDDQQQRCAVHKGWSGAGSNRRPSVFQAQFASRGLSLAVA
jgi:hypothetical protein